MRKRDRNDREIRTSKGTPENQGMVVDLDYDKKKPGMAEYDSPDDWILSMIMIAIIHANPGLPMKDVIQKSKAWARRIWMPQNDFVWRKQRIRIEKRGVRAEASKIRRELYALL